jgi:hypothetical protein
MPQDSLEIALSSWFLGALIVFAGILAPLAVVINKNKKFFQSAAFCCRRRVSRGIVE